MGRGQEQHGQPIRPGTEVPTFRSKKYLTLISKGPKGGITNETEGEGGNEECSTGFSGWREEAVKTVKIFRLIQLFMMALLLWSVLPLISGAIMKSCINDEYCQYNIDRPLMKGTLQLGGGPSLQDFAQFSALTIITAGYSSKFAHNLGI
jgi:hypothetical protein